MRGGWHERGQGRGWGERNEGGGAEGAARQQPDADRRAAQGLQLQSVAAWRQRMHRRQAARRGVSRPLARLSNRTPNLTSSLPPSLTS
jgi:hypothetical protein